MSPRNSEENPTEPKARSRAAEVPQEQEPNRVNLGCGTLVVLFLLVATVGKFLPYRDKTAAIATPSKTQSAGHKAKSEASVASKKSARPGSTEPPSTADLPSKEAITERASEVFSGVMSQLLNWVKPDVEKPSGALAVRGPVAPKTSSVREIKSTLARAAVPDVSEAPRQPTKADPVNRREAEGRAQADGIPSTVEPKFASPAPGKSQVFNSPWDNSVSQVERYLKRRMHDASSMEVLEWGKVSPTDRGGYQVRCTFRSKNVLGNYATQSKVFVMDRAGEVIDIRD